MIEDSIKKTFKDGKYKTGDLGGKCGTKEFTKAIIGNLEEWVYLNYLI